MSHPTKKEIETSQENLKVMLNGLYEAAKASELSYLKEEDVYLCPYTQDVVDEEYCKSFSCGTGCRYYGKCNRVKTKNFVEDEEESSTVCEGSST